MSVDGEVVCGVGGTLAVAGEEPEEWKELRVASGKGVNCEVMQALATNLLLRHWEWLDIREEMWVPGWFEYDTV